MRILIALLISGALLYIGSHQMGSLPPIGSFFSPHHGFWQNAESANDYPDGKLKIPGLSGHVNVLMDDRLVPHIYAESQADAYKVQGYMHAKYRLFQMDLTNRSTMGRLSEILGARTIEYDQKQRRMGLPMAARKVYTVWQKDKKVADLMDAYASGVNAYIDQLQPADYPIEYKLLDFKPEPFTALNIASLYISMANVLCSYSRDVEQSNNLSWLGKEQFDFLFPDYNPKQSPVIPSEKIWDFEPVFKDNQTNTKTSPIIGHIDIPSFSSQNPHIGSNNWAIAPKKSASGKAILANDPHLNLTLPSVWFENHIVTPDLNVYGVSFPGAPGVIIGFNEDIAWGTTNASHDVIDWYTVNYVDDTKRTYYLDGRQVPVEIQVEDIQVKGRGIVYDTVNYTHWGPIWNKGGQEVSLKWVIHNDLKSNSFATFIQLNSAKNYSDYINALQHFEAPIQNLIFADKKGNIALTVQGKMPIRRSGQGGIVRDGTTTVNDWSGFVPYDHVPNIKNPNQGYITSTNQHSTHHTYPYYYHGKFDDYRGRFINILLNRKSKISVDDCKDFQNNNYSIEAQELLQAILPHINLSELTDHEKLCIKLLSEWNYTFSAQKKEPSLYAGIKKEINLMLWDEFTDTQENDHRPEVWRTIELLNSSDEHPFFDIKETTEIENREKLCTQLFKKAMSPHSEVSTIPEWHSVKATSIGHLARISAFSQDVATDGYKQSLNAQTATTGPSWRMIVEMSDPIKAYGVYPGGQSGNPGSTHYTDMIDRWSAGEYYPLQYARNPDDINDVIFNLTFN